MLNFFPSEKKKSQKLNTLKIHMRLITGHDISRLSGIRIILQHLILVE